MAGCSIQFGRGASVAVQRLLGRPGRPRPKTHKFAFTGQIRCGECGCSVTAEHKVNRFGSRYLYYHCTHRRLDYACRQRSISGAALGHQVAVFLRGLTMPDRFHAWSLTRLARESSHREDVSTLKHDSLIEAKASVDRQLDTLLGLRLRDLIGDDELQARRRTLETDRIALLEQIEQPRHPSGWFEPVHLVISFARAALAWFRLGDLEMQRLILQATSSNPTLRNGIFNATAAKPFRTWRDQPLLPTLSPR